MTRQLVACPTLRGGWSAVVPRLLQVGALLRRPRRLGLASPGQLGFHPDGVAVVDHGSLHHSGEARAAMLADCARWCVPVLCLDHPPSALAESDLDDDELVGAAVASARLAWLRSTTTPVTLSVVAATRRPGRLGHLARQLAPQAAHAQVIVALHGEGFGGDAEAVIRNAVPDALVLRFPSSTPFGAVLQAASARADGDWLSKVDDDDHYAAHHVEELRLTAAAEPGASVVGRAAEFVHLAEPDVTVRRRFSVTAGWADGVAGGTLTVSRDALDGVGGWRPLDRAVDRDLLDRVLGAGGRVFRAPPFGYLLERHGEGHTWEVDAERLLTTGVRHWRGRALDVAGVT